MFRRVILSILVDCCIVLTSYAEFNRADIDRQIHDARTLKRKCGIVALARISAFYGNQIHLAAIESEFTTINEAGVEFNEIAAVGRRLGLSCRIVAIDANEVGRKTSLSPCILLMNQKTHVVVLDHSVVTEGFVRFWDPTSLQYVEMNAEMFRENYNGYGIVFWNLRTNYGTWLMVSLSVVLMALLIWKIIRIRRYDFSFVKVDPRNAS